MIRQLKEGEITWLEGLTMDELPGKLPMGIRIHLRSGMLGLEVQGLVGAIPLENGDTLQIIPKIGKVNFIRLLLKAGGDLDGLKSEFESFVNYDLEEEGNLDIIMARRFFFCLDEILSKSPMSGREWLVKQANFAYGSIDIVKTIHNLSSKRTVPVISSFKQRVFNIPENRILTEAAIRSWSLLDLRLKKQFEPVFNLWLNKFSRAIDINRDLLVVEQRFSKNSYGGARDYYRHALMLAKVILGTNGIGFGSEQLLFGDAVLINTADTFEKYIRNLIVNTYSHRGFIVTKGGVGSESLYLDGTYELIPDIVIQNNGKIVAIVDVKYKVPTAQDHYQMLAYLAAYQFKKGLLIAPLFSGDEPIVKEYVTPKKTSVKEIYLPMNDLNLTESLLSSLLEQFVL